MNSKISFLFLLQATINVVNLATPQTFKPQQMFSCRNIGNLRNESHRKRRDNLINYMSRTIGVGKNFTGFEMGYTAGKLFEDEVLAFFLCPTVIQHENCAKCVNKTIPYLIQKCGNKKEGVAWTIMSNFVTCIVRYAGYDFEKKYELWASWNFSSPDASAAPGDLSPAVLKFGKELSEKAYRIKYRTYASGKTMYGLDKRDIYMELQCSYDLKYADCQRCLNDVASVLQKLTMLGKISAIALNNNCYTRYDHVPISPTIYSSGETGPFGFATYTTVYDYHNSDGLGN